LIIKCAGCHKISLAIIAKWFLLGGGREGQFFEVLHSQQETSL